MAAQTIATLFSAMFGVIGACSSLAPLVMASVHPSSIQRAPDDETRHREIDCFIDDLKVLARTLREQRAA